LTVIGEARVISGYNDRGDTRLKRNASLRRGLQAVGLRVAASMDRPGEQPGIAEARYGRGRSAAEPERSLREEFRPALPLGRLLIEAGLIGENDLEKGLAFQRRYGGRLGSILVRLGALSEERLLPILSAQLSIPLLGERDLPSDPAAYLEAIEQSAFNGYCGGTVLVYNSTPFFRYFTTPDSTATRRRSLMNAVPKVPREVPLSTIQIELPAS